MPEISAFMIAAEKSGSGKTVVTCAMLAALKKQGLNPVSFKCGPDYIDPMFHQKVIGVPSRNLDVFLMGEAGVGESYKRGIEGPLFLQCTDNRVKPEIAVIEGVMGLYDGLGGTERASSYHVASILDVPIVLLFNADTAENVDALFERAKAMIEKDVNKLIRGFIINRSSSEGYEDISSKLSEILDIPCFGYVAPNDDLILESRHLGLKTAHEIDDISERFNRAGSAVSETVDIVAITELAKTKADGIVNANNDTDGSMPLKNKTIAYARDEAFCFIYEDNIDYLKEQGADVIYFSPLHDSDLPEGIDGVVIPGGYPELYAEGLSANRSMGQSIKKAYSDGIPFIAECGGFMYLLKTMVTKDGKSYEMCGCIDGRSSYTGHLVRFGYSLLSYKSITFPIHEFHYFDTDNNGSDAVSKKPLDDRRWECCHIDQRHYLGFPHLYFPAAKELVLSILVGYN